jgi:hypothetical protein
VRPAVECLEERRLLSAAGPQVIATGHWTGSNGATYDMTTVHTGPTGSPSWNLSTPGATVQSAFIPVTSGKTYTFAASLESGVAPAMADMYIGVYNASKTFKYNYAGSYQATTAANTWQPTDILYTAQPGDAYIRLKYMRLPAGRGPTGAGSLRVTALRLTQGVNLAPDPSPKQAFNGSMVRVDAQGNWSVLRNNTWQPFFVFGIYNESPVNTPQTYSDQGFNTLFSNAFSLDLLQQAKDAVSRFNPDGMMSMIDISAFIDPRSSKYDNLTLLRQDLTALEHSPLISQVLGFYWDNEQYDNYNVARAVTDLVRQYDVNAAGQRQHPIYMLEGQQGTDPLYDRLVDVVGDYVRSPQTASYLGPQQDITQRAAITADLPGQTKPFSIATISNEAYGKNLNDLIQEALIAGARGIAFYADGVPYNYNGPAQSPAATNITRRDFWPELPTLAAHLERLEPLLRQPAETTWGLSASNGQVIYGTRTDKGQDFVLLVNPTSSAQAVTFTVQGLPYTARKVKDYFTGSTVAPVSFNRFTIVLQPNQTAVYSLAGSTSHQADVDTGTSARRSALAAARERHREEAGHGRRRASET